MSRQAQSRVYTAVVSPDPSGGYTITIPALPGVISQGDTREEAVANVVEAAELWIEVEREAGQAIPADGRAAVLQGIQDALAIREELGWPLELEILPVNVPGPIAEAA